jgi:DNA-binding CsgD family transcriptional regulator
MTDSITGLPCSLSQALPHASQCGSLEEARIAQSAQAIHQGMKRLMDEAAENLRPLVESITALMAFRGIVPDKARAVEFLARDIDKPPRARARRADGEPRNAEHRRVVFDAASTVVPSLSGNVRLPQAMRDVQAATVDAYSASRREDHWMGGDDIKIELGERTQSLTRRKTERVARYEWQDEEVVDVALLPMAEERLDQRRLLASIYERCSLREQQLLNLAWRDIPESQMAKILGITPATVRVMWTHIGAKALAIGST